jgi:hypothetical protein
MCAGEALVNLELHAMDFLDAADGLVDLAPHVAELRVPLARRTAALESALDTLASAGHAFVTLEEAAGSLTP